MPMTDTQKEISQISADFVKNQLDNMLIRSTSREAKIGFFFMLAVCLLKNKDSVVNVAKVIYPNEHHKVIRAIFEKISDFLNANDPTNRYIAPILDERFYADKSNLPRAKQQTLQEFAVFLSNDLKGWMNDSLESNHIEHKDFMPLFERHHERMVEDEPRPSSPAP